MPNPLFTHRPTPARVALAVLLLLLTLLAVLLVLAWLGGSGEGGFVYEGFN